MHQLDIGIATQLAKYGGAFDGFITQAIQLPEQRNATDFGHGFGLL
jgi:hypothetical protein